MGQAFLSYRPVFNLSPVNRVSYSPPLYHLLGLAQERPLEGIVSGI